MRMRKTAAAVICLIVLALSPMGGLYGCGAEPFVDQPVDVELPFDTEGSLKIGCKDESHEVAIMQTFVDSFRLKYPNVKVTLERMNSTDYNQTIIQYHQADLSKPGSMPDILEFAYEVFPFIEKNIVKNLQPYVNAAVDKGLFDPADYYQNVYKSGQKNFGGDQYLMPRSYDHTVSYYNKRIFRDAGAEEPKNGWTWNQFVDSLQKIRDYFDLNGKRHLYLIDSYLDWEAVYNPIYESCGVRYFDESGNVELNTDGTRRALALMQELLTKRFIGPYGGDSSNANYEGGQGAMMFHTTSTKNRWYEALGDDFGVASFPLIGDSPVVGAGSAGYAMYSRSRNANLAWAFLSHVMSREGQEAASMSGAVVPIRTDMADIDTNEWAKYPAGPDKINQAAFIYRTELDRPTSYMVRFDPKFSADLMNAVKSLGVETLKVSKPLTAQQSIDKAIETINTILSDPY